MKAVRPSNYTTACVGASRRSAQAAAEEGGAGPLKGAKASPEPPDVLVVYQPDGSDVACAVRLAEASQHGSLYDLVACGGSSQPHHAADEGQRPSAVAFSEVPIATVDIEGIKV